MNDDEFFDFMEEQHDDYLMMQEEQRRKNGSPPPKNSGSGCFGPLAKKIYGVIVVIAMIVDVVMVILYAATGRLGELWGEVKGGWFLIIFTGAVFAAAIALGIYLLAKAVKKRRMRSRKKPGPAPGDSVVPEKDETGGDR